MRFVQAVLFLTTAVALPLATTNLVAREVTRDADEVVANTWVASNPSNDPNQGLRKRDDDADEMVANTWVASNPSNDPNGALPKRNNVDGIPRLRV